MLPAAEITFGQFLDPATIKQETKFLEGQAIPETMRRLSARHIVQTSLRQALAHISSLRHMWMHRHLTPFLNGHS